MDKRTIYITNFDFWRLRSLLDAGPVRFPMDVQELRKMNEELDRAIIVPPEDIPHDIITMNSEVRLSNLNTGEDSIFSLVFPDDANIDENRISVLAPAGTAMLGYRVGDTISWRAPAGFTRLRVGEVLYQPEAARSFRE